MIWMGVIYYLSDQPIRDFDNVNEAVKWLTFATLIVHVTLYLILSGLVLRMLIRVNLLSQALIGYTTILWAFIYGVLDEIHQSGIEGRSSEIIDVIADGFGALIVVIFWFLQKKYPVLLRTIAIMTRTNSNTCK